VGDSGMDIVLLPSRIFLS